MNLPEIAIKRPVFAFMLSAVLVIFGIISYFKIGVQETPNINFPSVSITTMLPGASPSLVDQTVSKPIESVLNTIAGIQHIQTTSTEGKSEIDLQFAIGQNMDQAFIQVQSKLNQVQGALPSDAKPPIISQSEAGAQPIMLLALYGHLTTEQLNNLARDVMKPKLENIEGVGSVTIQGNGKEVLYINLDFAKMAGLHLSPQDVQSAVSDQHVQQPGGYIQTGSKQYTLNLNLEFHTLPELENMIVAYRDNAPIRLKDIATVKMGNQDQQSFAEFNGMPTVGVSIVKKSDANTVSITQIINDRIKTEIRPLLPKELKINVVYAAATYILQIVHSLEMDVWLSIFAAGFVIWLFLRNIRSTAIIVTAIPVSLLGVVMMMYFIGYTFNIITLLGLILLVGVVVDDAIVVLENIHRHGEAFHLDAMNASLQGSKQVLFAVLASSLTLISIFLPVIFMGSIVGLFFKSFAVVVSTGVLISLFVSLTLTPMFCSRFFKFDRDVAEKKPSKIYQKLESGFEKIDATYRKLLNFALRRRWMMVALAVVMVGISVPLFMIIGKGFLPAENDSGYFYITLQTPQGSSTNYTKGRIEKVEEVLQRYPEISNYFASVSQANQGSITVQLAQGTLRIPQDELMPLIEKQLQEIPGMISFVSSSGAAGSMTFSVLGPQYDNTIKAAMKLYGALQKESALGSMYLDLSLNQPEYVAVLDRALANSLGITPREFTSTLTVLGNGIKIAKFNKIDATQQQDIILRATPGQFNSPDDISQIYLSSNQNEAVRLDTVASLYSSLSPVSITRLDMNYSVGFSTSPTMSTSKAIALVEAIAEKVLPQGYVVKMTGNTASMSQTVKTVLGTFVLIILLIYMVLASQFNSFIQPLIILIAQPLALIGGVFMLWITGQTINIYSMIGMLLLMGLVAKNSILLIDLTNHLRNEGKSIQEALTTACPLRMRPVLMTSMAIIFAMLPSALAGGPGSDSHRPLSLVIIGGMISSTLLTLVIVPAVYSLVEGALSRLRSQASE